MPRACDADNDWYEIGDLGETVYAPRSNEIGRFMETSGRTAPTDIAIVTDYGYNPDDIPDEILQAIDNDYELTLNRYVETGNPFVNGNDNSMRAVDIQEDGHKRRAAVIIRDLGYDVEVYDEYALYQFVGYINGGILYVKTME